MHKVVDGILVELTEAELLQVAKDTADAEERAKYEEGLSQILALEAAVTQRRLREAALTDEGKTWLADVDAQIAALRAQRV